MKYQAKIAKNGKAGEVSSKYGLRPELFEQDIAERAEKDSRLYAEFIEWMRQREMDPETVRRMFVSFYYDFIDKEGGI